MKQRLQGLMAGVLIGATITGGAAIAANTTTLYDVIANGVKIVVDGKKLNPTDVNGNKVEPIIYNGTTYLPVRAVANALGKAVYWDGPNYTVYLGDMNGNLEYPTEELSCDDNIGYDSWRASNNLRDNYDNIYTNAIYQSAIPWGIEPCYQKLCGMKYSRFKGIIYVKRGSTCDGETALMIKADNKTIYTSPIINKTSAPIEFDVDITGCNDLKITFINDDAMLKDICIGNGGFYQ